MSKLFSISLAIIILFQSIGLSAHSLLEVNIIITHAQLHSEQYGDNIFVFLSKHYGDLKAEHQKDHHKDHEKLPFSHHSSIVTLKPFILSNATGDLKQLEILEFKKHHFYYQEAFTLGHKKGRLQAPKHS